MFSPNSKLAQLILDFRLAQNIAGRTLLEKPSVRGYFDLTNPHYHLNLINIGLTKPSEETPYDTGIGSNLGIT